MNCAQVRSAYWKEEKPQRIVASLRPSGLSVCSDLLPSRYSYLGDLCVKSFVVKVFVRSSGTQLTNPGTNLRIVFAFVVMPEWRNWQTR